MISYELFCKIRLLRDSERFSAAQIARNTGLDEKTVRRWLAMASYEPRQGVRRPSKLALYKTLIKRWIEQADFTGAQIYDKLRGTGYTGGITILNDYLRLVRPKPQRAYLTQTFLPGEAAQIDWGCYQSVQVGSTRRKLSFIAVVLSYSRVLYVEFFLQERMEHFLAGLQNAFLYFGAVPRTLIVDNLKCAVYDHRRGQEPTFNPRFIDFARHYGSAPFACNPRAPYEKGQVESGVGYIKGNLLRGRNLSELPPDDPLAGANAWARQWMESIANTRRHQETKTRPIDLIEQDKAAMLPVNLIPYDNGITTTARVNNRCRVHCDANRYSVPPRYASRRVQLHTYHDKICLYDQTQLIATHPRSYDRYQQIVNPDHERELLDERTRAKQAAELVDFQTLDVLAPVFLTCLRERRHGFMTHVRKILALAAIHPPSDLAEAIREAHQIEAYSAETILNLLDRKQRHTSQPAPISATEKTRPFLDIRLAPPNLSQYTDPKPPKAS